MGKPGRPAKYRNVAEKQKAYRERQKDDQARVDLGLKLLHLAEEYETKLRNVAAYWDAKGKRCELYYRRSVADDYEFFHCYVDGRYHTNYDPLVYHLMLAKGVLVEVGKGVNGIGYKVVTS